jgi:hypothetical protein
MRHHGARELAGLYVLAGQRQDGEADVDLQIRHGHGPSPIEMTGQDTRAMGAGKGGYTITCCQSPRVGKTAAGDAT